MVEISELVLDSQDEKEEGISRCSMRVAHGNSDQRLTAARSPLVIVAEPTPPHHPGEGLWNDPSSGLGTTVFWEECVPIDRFPLVDQQPPPGNSKRLHGLDRPPQCEPGPGVSAGEHPSRCRVRVASLGEHVEHASHTAPRECDSALLPYEKRAQDNETPVKRHLWSSLSPPTPQPFRLSIGSA